MAEKEKQEKKPQLVQKAQQKPEAKKESKRPQQEERSEILVRIFGYDVPGSKNLLTGLTRIKGISWAISNAACLRLNMPRSKKVSDLTKDEIKRIEEFLPKINVPDFMKNRRLDRETGQTAHLYGSDLDIAKEFDIKRLKKIKSYKGIRHALKQPVRGQRTRSHFRTNKIAGGKVKKHEKKA